MQRLALVTAIAAFGLLVDTAWAAPVTVTTTKGDVQKQCGNKVGCSTACGSTSCDYGCDKKGKCTVTIDLVRPRGGRGGSASSGVNAGTTNSPFTAFNGISVVEENFAAEVVSICTPKAERCSRAVS
jgi:hypothetical protein